MIIPCDFIIRVVHEIKVSREIFIRAGPYLFIKVTRVKKDIMNDRAGSSDTRINKLLSDAGVCSRRQADRLIEQGKVLIDGRPACAGQRVKPGQKVLVDGKPVSRQEKLVLIALNKPRGIVCTTDRKREKNNIVDFVHYPTRIYPVGRLDKESEGLILLTNDGSLVNRIMKASSGHEKEYQVRVDKPLTDEFIRRMSSGVPILDTVTRPCRVKKTGRSTFSIILTQGLNRQIRRMCEYLGYHVEELKRVRIMNIELGHLKTGQWRRVTGEEIMGLKAAFIRDAETGNKAKDKRSGYARGKNGR